MQICIPRSQKDRCRIHEKGAGSRQKQTKYTNYAGASTWKAFIYKASVALTAAHKVAHFDRKKAVFWWLLRH